MDRNDADNIININSEERDSRAGRGNKKIAAVFLFDGAGLSWRLGLYHGQN